MNRRGFTLVEIMIVVGVVGLLAAMALPSFMRARNQAQQNACINNLRMIDAGKEQASFELRLASGSSAPTTAVNAYIKGEKTPLCPAGGTYTYNVISQNPTCNMTSPTSHRLK